MNYCWNRLDYPVFIAASKPLLTEFGIHDRLENCEPGDPGENSSPVTPNKSPALSSFPCEIPSRFFKNTLYKCFSKIGRNFRFEKNVEFLEFFCFTFCFRIFQAKKDNKKLPKLKLFTTYWTDFGNSWTSEGFSQSLGLYLIAKPRFGAYKTVLLLERRFAINVQL